MFYIDEALMKRSTLSAEKGGGIRVRFDSSNRPRMDVLCYNNTGGVVVAGQIYMVKFDGDEESDPQVITPVVSPNLAAHAAAAGNPFASGAMTPDIIVVATSGYVAGGWGWYAYRGWISALVDGTVAVAKDDDLRVIVASSTTALVKDAVGGTGVYNVAQAGAARSGAAASTLIRLYGKRVQVT